MKKQGTSLVVMLLLLSINTNAFAQTSQSTELVSTTYVTLLSLMPILLFVVLFIIIMVSTNWRELLHDVLSDKEAAPISKTIQPMLDKSGNHIHINGEPQSTTVDIYPKSASRLVLFCSSFAAIFISLCMVSASIYSYLLKGDMPDFDKLLGVLLSLGIGVIPYAVNKIKKGGNDTAQNNIVNIPPPNDKLNTPT